MASIIMSGIFVVAIFIALITCIVKKEVGASLACLLVMAAFVGLLIMSINGYKYGSYSDLVTKYGMKHTGTELSGTYTKDNLVFNHKSYKEDFEDHHSIKDNGNMNLNLHSRIIENFIKIKEGCIQLIYNHLKDYSEHFEKNSEITITTNHTRIEITYNYRENELNYDITVVKEFRYVEDDDDNTIKETNKDYKTKYVQTKLELEHYNEDYQEYDKELLDLIFNKDINDFDVNKYNYMVQYTLN